jgi:hypothetical protein
VMDPAYAFEFDRLADLCHEFLAAHAPGDEGSMLLVTGMMLVQLATIYKLSPPAGILDPRTLFERPGE